MMKKTMLYLLLLLSVLLLAACQKQPQPEIDRSGSIRDVFESRDALE